MTSSVEEFLSPQDEQEIVGAIRVAELSTSGEIRVHIERHAKIPTLERAQELFHLLKMDNTKEENGVLIYIAVDDHKLAICGDRGINSKVPKDFWESTKDKMIQSFTKGNFKEGILLGVSCAGKKLSTFFPWQHGDENELPNEITTS
jgi:uncharacterized membrane protein